MCFSCFVKLLQQKVVSGIFFFLYHFRNFNEVSFIPSDFIHFVVVSNNGRRLPEIRVRNELPRKLNDYRRMLNCENAVFHLVGIFSLNGEAPEN